VRAAFVDQHFDQYFNFLVTEKDPPMTKKVSFENFYFLFSCLFSFAYNINNFIISFSDDERLLLNMKPKDICALISSFTVENAKLHANFKISP
jgi:hypothetical protein